MSKRIVVPFLLVVLVAAAGWQAARAGAEADRARARLHGVRSEVQKLEAAAAQRDVFRQQLEELGAQVADVSRRLPPTLAVDDFVAGLAARAEPLGVTLEHEVAGTEALELYEQAHVDLRLQGEPEAIATLADRVASGDRLARWQPQASDPGRASVTIYALPRDENPAPPAACGAPGEPGGLWPFGGQVRELRQEIDAACGRLEELESIRGEVLAYERHLAWVERGRALIQHLGARAEG